MGEQLTDEQRKDRIQALLRERRGYELYGTSDQVAEVDRQLDHYGFEAKKPSERATRLKRDHRKL